MFEDGRGCSILIAGGGGGGTTVIFNLEFLKARERSSMVNPFVAFLSLHPLCGGGDLLFLPSPPAAATCFGSQTKTPARIISKYLYNADWPFNKLKDGRQNPMLLSRA